MLNLLDFFPRWKKEIEDIRWALERVREERNEWRCKAENYMHELTETKAKIASQEKELKEANGFYAELFDENRNGKAELDNLQNKLDSMSKELEMTNRNFQEMAKTMDAQTILHQRIKNLINEILTEINSKRIPVHVQAMATP